MKSLKEYIISSNMQRMHVVDTHKYNIKESQGSFNKDVPESIQLYDFTKKFDGFQIYDLIEGKTKFRTLVQAFRKFGVKDYEYTLYTLRKYVDPYTLRTLSQYSTLPESDCFDYIINGTKTVVMRMDADKLSPVMKDKTINKELIIYILLEPKIIYLLPRLDLEYIDDGYACILDDEKYIDGTQTETQLYKNLCDLYHDREEIDWLYDRLYKGNLVVGNKGLSAYEHNTWDEYNKSKNK